MKNKLIALLVALVFVFTGCSGVQADYWAKMKEVSKWEGSETHQKGSAVIQLGPEQIKMDFTTTATMNQKTMSGYMNMEMTMEMPQSLMVPEEGTVEVAQVAPQPITFNMEMYLDKGKVYIGKSYFEQLLAISGMPVPEALTKLDADYIGIKESNDMVTQMLQLMGDKAQIDKLLKVYEDITALLGIDIAVAKEGNTYTITLGKEEIVALMKNVMTNAVANIEKINDQFALGLTKEDMIALKEQFTAEKANVETQIDQIAALVDGNLTWKTTFEKDKEIDQLTFKVGPSADAAQLAAMMFGGEVGMEMTLDQTATKVAAKEVKMPEKIVELNEVEISKLLGMEMPVVEQEMIPLTPAINK